MGNSVRKSASEITRDPTATIAYATIQDNLIALAVHCQSGFDIYVLEIDGAQISEKTKYTVNAEATCVALGRISGQVVVLVGTLQDQSVVLLSYPVDEARASTMAVEPIEFSTGELADATVIISIGTDLECVATAKTSEGRNGPLLGTEPIEALTNIVFACEDPQESTLAVGTRSGHIFILKLRAGGYEMYPYKFGPSPAEVFLISFPGEPASIMTCNGSEIAMMTNSSGDDQRGSFEKLYRVWPADADDPTAPSINSVTRFHRQGAEEAGTLSLVMIAGSRILFSQLQRQPLPVPRYFRVGGAPTQVLYSNRLETVVAVVSKNRTPSLHFFDPETGQDLSRPIKEVKDKEGVRKSVDADYIELLGIPDTRIYALSNWRYQQDGNVWEWIVIGGGTRYDDGFLIVVSAEIERHQALDGSSRQIRFWSRLKRVEEHPVYSVTTDDHGVFICCGQSVQYLQPVDKRLRVIKEYELPSSAAQMQVVNGQLHVVTVEHSLMILDYRSRSTLAENQMTLIHSDQAAKKGMHSIQVGTFLDGAGGRIRPITMMSDLLRGVYGLWPASADEDNVRTVFRGSLEASVRRFARGHTRPLWQLATRRPRYGYLESGARDTRDVLGVSLDGSLRHFTLLGPEAWRFLRFVQNLATAAADTRPDDGSGSFDPEPYADFHAGMHVDGDVLQRCLDGHLLEQMVAAYRPQHALRFRQLLGAVMKADDRRAAAEPGAAGGLEGPGAERGLDGDEDGDGDGDAKAREERHFRLAYHVLEYYLAPVL